MIHSFLERLENTGNIRFVIASRFGWWIWCAWIMLQEPVVMIFFSALYHMGVRPLRLVPIKGQRQCQGRSDEPEVSQHCPTYRMWGKDRSESNCLRMM